MSTPEQPSREDMLDLIAAYAIHAVDDDERAFVEAHLDDDPSYREELGRHLITAASLTVEAPVPASTWDAITARTRGTSSRESVPSASERMRADDSVNSGPRSVSGSSIGSAAGTSVGALDPARANVIALDAARASRRSRVRVAVAAAAVSAAVVVPLTLQFAGNGGTSIAALASKAASQRGSRLVNLAGPDGLSLGEAVVTADGRGYLRRDSLPALPEGQTYQLWAVTGETPVSAGLLGRDPSVMAFTVDAPTTALAVSVEPSSGSTQPSSTPVASGALV